MNKETKESFLKTFDEFIEYITAKEKAEFKDIKLALKITIDEEVIRKARKRDLKRSVKFGNDVYDQRHEALLADLVKICPDFAMIVSKLDYSHFGMNRRKKITKDQILTTTDWKKIYNFCKAIMK